jgi:hypothetical protein
VARRLIAVLAGSMLAASACAEPAPPTLATGSLEAALPASVWPDDPSVVTDIDCPDVDPALIAQSTTCTASLDGEAITVDVSIDELGSASAVVREPLFVVAEAADALVGRLRADLGIEAIDAACAGVVVIAAVDRAIACEASDGSRVIEFELVLGVSNGSGSWTLRVVN